MSFKTWSAAQSTPVNKPADDKAKDAPPAAAPPAKTPEKLAVQGPLLRKS